MNELKIEIQNKIQSSSSLEVVKNSVDVLQQERVPLLNAAVAEEELLLNRIEHVEQLEQLEISSDVVVQINSM